MRKILISAAVIASALAAVPASAQNYNRGGNFEQQLDQVEQRIDRAADRRTISRREAEALSRQANQLDRLHDRYRRNGLTRWERDDLQSRLQNLRQRIRFERQDDRYGRDDRYDRNDRNDRYDRDDRYNRR